MRCDAMRCLGVGIVVLVTFGVEEGIAKAQCPPNVAFGCSLSGADATNPGWKVTNSLGDGILGYGNFTGIHGVSTGNGFGVQGFALTLTGPAFGVRGLIQNPSGDSAAVLGQSNATTGDAIGVKGITLSPGGSGVWGQGGATSGNSYGVYGSTTSPTGYGVYGSATGGTGINYGVFGETSSQYGYGVYGRAFIDYPNAYGVTGKAYNGVYGLSENALGNGIIGTANFGSLAYGVWGVSTNGYAGYFSGKVHVSAHLTVSGTLSVSGTKNFKIDHPLDPANKYLFHAALESPEVLNVYSGKVILDARGEAWVSLPPYFESLNTDYRYQLTSVGSAAPNLHVSQRVTGNRFKIAGGPANGEVSWAVTGIRNDPYVVANRLQPEQAKPADEVGSYLYPTGYGQPASKSLEQVRLTRKR